MTYTAQPIDDFAQRLAIIRRHINGIMLAVDALEREMQQRQAAQPDGERAAQRARDAIYQQRPPEVKIIRDGH